VFAGDLASGNRGDGARARKVPRLQGDGPLSLERERKDQPSVVRPRTRERGETRGAERRRGES